VSGAWAFALLQQGEQSEDGVSGELCAGPRRVAPSQVSGRDRDAQPHEVPIGHEDMAGAVRRVADRQDGEAAAEERVSGVGYLDLLGGRVRRVLEQGILLLSRSILWIMPNCGAYSVGGCVTGCYCG
jgi:hypothetical protein